jgi:NAD(P)-dependent dehydrogenase (short-subunit alcohol dehydrogenase family)
MGLATARAFAEAEAAVVIADFNQTTIGMATDELTAAGHQVLAVRCDVSEEDSVAAMVKAARSHGGDIIVHRASPRRGIDRAHLASPGSRDGRRPRLSPPMPSSPLP